MGTRVYVGGLPRDATARELEDGFLRYGKICNVWIARNPPGFAFLDFEDPRDADDAIRSMDNADYLGGRIRVELARGNGRGGDRNDSGGRGRDRFNDRTDRFGRDQRGGRNNAQRGEFKVIVSDLPEGADWRQVKDFLRTGGEVTFCNLENSDTAVAEFRTREDMEQAIKKLDDTEFQGNYVRITAADKGSDRRSVSPQAATQRSDW